MNTERLVDLSIREFQKVIKDNLEFDWGTSRGQPPRSGRINMLKHEKKNRAYDSSSKALRSWEITADTHRELENVESLPNPDLIKDSMFYDLLVGWFSISPDQSSIEISWQTGPRFGRGFIYQIKAEHNDIPYLGRPTVTWMS